MTEDGKEQMADERSRPLLSRVKTISILAGVITFGASLLLVAILSQKTLISTSQKLTTQHTNPCGNSTAEARSLGCTFDQLMWSWFPQECPHYANTEFLNAEAEPFKYYVNPYDKIVATDEDWAKMLDNELQLFGERREHLLHCLFMYVGLGEAFRTRGRYTPVQVNQLHLKHCETILLDVIRMDDRRFEITEGTPSVKYNQAC